MPDVPEPSFLTADDGVQIAYRVWPGTGTSAVPVVLQHGFVVDTYVNWVAPGVVAALVALGRTVVGVDARGHGRSGKPHDPARYGEARMSRDLRAVVDEIGAERYDLVGYSMGAVIALITAATDARVRRVVVGGVGAGIVELGGVDTRAMDRGTLADVLAADDVPADLDPALRGFRQLADAVGADRLALAAQARSVHASPLDLAAITAPLLLLAGDTDPLATRPEVLAGAVTDGRLHLLAGDHVTVLGDPGFVPAIVDFVSAA